MFKEILKNFACNKLRGIFILVAMFFVRTNLAFALDVSVDSQKYPVEVYGDYLEYRTKDEQVVTKGKAFISYQDMKISGENIQANTKTEDIFAQGNVDFWKGYDEVSGDFIVYNMKTGKGWMRNAQVKKSRNFFKAKEVYISPEHSVAKELMQTTCDNIDHPHYRLEARLLETYPGHSMTMEGLRAKWKGKTIFYQARNHSNQEKNDKFFSTRQGSSGIDGYYLKLTTDLLVNEYLSGKLNYDWYEKRGMGFGFNGTYTTPRDHGNGSIYIYHLDESKKNHENTQVNFSYNVNFTSGETFSTNINYTGDKYSGEAENQDMTVQINFKPVFKFMNMTVTANKFFDLDNDKYTADNAYQFVNRLPEINFSFPSVTTPVIPLTLNFSGMYGRYEEGTASSSTYTEKKDGRLSVSSPACEVNSRFQFTPSYTFEKSLYTGDIERENGNTMVVYSISTMTLFTYIIIKGESFGPYPMTNWIWFLLLAIIPNLLGHTLFNWSLKWVSTNVISIAILFEPIGAAILAWYIFGEYLTLLQVLGGSIVIVGITMFVIDFKKLKELF